MTYKHEILRAILRISRKESLANLEAVHLRVGGSLSQLRNALRILEAADLVVRRGNASVRLTFTGLALGVALARSGKVPRVTSVAMREAA